jgi:diacylglycerol kinase family enzyme
MASLHDGLLDIVIVNKMSKPRMIWSVLRQIKYGQLKAYDNIKYQRAGIHYFQTAALTIHNPNSAPLHIDGDPAGTAQHFDIKIIEKAFRLIVGY